MRLFFCYNLSILAQRRNKSEVNPMKTAYYNAKVYPGRLPLTQAFLVENGRFVMTGSDAEILSALSDGDERVDLRGCFVCPGFNDSHMHLLSFGNVLRMANLAAHTHSLSGMLEAVRAFLAQHPPRGGVWLLGRGWNQDLFEDVHRMPTRHDLDAISSAIPILLTRACGHCCVVNTKALEQAGIHPDTAAPEGGAIDYENGLLYDNAIGLAERGLPTPGKDEIRAMLRAACREVNRYGITSVQTDDYQVFHGVPWQTVNEVYREMASNGELTVRVCEQAQFTDVDSLRDFAESGLEAGGEMFRIGPVKLLGDGSLGSRTAHLSRPYADAPDTRGFSLFPEDTLNALVACAHNHGMRVAVHAIGDACLDQVLNAIEGAMISHPRQDPRHGIVHCQITRPDQLERMRRLGLHIYAQSIFLDYDNHIVEQRVGEKLAASSYNWKTLLNAGVSVSNGSDCPVELPNVMAGIECAVTRTSLDGTGPYLPDQAFTVQEALDSFTWHGAEASFEEGEKGRIGPGYLADFTALGENPFEVEAHRLHDIQVLGCYLGGKRVYPA